MHTWVQIDAKAISHNLCQFKKIIGKHIDLMPVIKANAYGHGFLEIARICNKISLINTICVVSDDEAELLIDNKINKNILILSIYSLKNDKKLLKLAKKNVFFNVFSLEQAKILNKIGERIKKPINIHIKIDTGTSRTGFIGNNKYIKSIINLIKNYKYIDISGFFSHFASSENDREYTQKQIKKFDGILNVINNEVNTKNIFKHFACSSASILYPTARYSSIRLGLGLYGLYPNKISKKIINLKPALSWHTKIIQIKKLPKNTKIGYGGTYTTKKTTKIAILPIGYWDGYDRALSNKASVLIKGYKCPVRGKVCMNLTMVELPYDAKIRINDKVTLIGKQNNQVITADDLANYANTINYEIITRINPLIKRIVT